MNGNTENSIAANPKQKLVPSVRAGATVNVIDAGDRQPNNGDCAGAMMRNLPSVLGGSEFHRIDFVETREQHDNEISTQNGAGSFVARRDQRTHVPSNQQGRRDRASTSRCLNSNPQPGQSSATVTSVNEDQLVHGNFTKKRPRKRRYSMVLHSVQWYRNPHCPGYADKQQRYSVDRGMKYLGEGMRVCEQYWGGVWGNKSPTEFLRALMEIFWEPYVLCNSSFEPENCRPDKFIPGRCRPTAIEFEKLRLILSIYDDYLMKNHKHMKLSYLMNAITIMSNNLRDLRLVEREKAMQMALNRAREESRAVDEQSPRQDRGIPEQNAMT
ncbi:hypothetical protein QAD02_014074 [Eretmocerus hayati]|uniref:Uncharacterized protein n=1 Tax=Eretmocerus hayati TaxID=131215 RepID=A0ACC2P4I9_9HYME|nr:hypothetical protein QAD02_014074 [Eretmocerus hayati]